MLIQAILYGLVCIMTALMPDAGNMLTLKALDSGLIQHTLTTVSFTHPKTRLFPTQNRTLNTLRASMACRLLMLSV